MLPLLHPGDEVLVDMRAYRRSFPAVGDVIVIRSPDRPDMHLIKRVAAVRRSGACFVRGDNPSQSTDSRAFGWVEPQFVLGRAIGRFF